MESDKPPPELSWNFNKPLISYSAFFLAGRKFLFLHYPLYHGGK